MKTPRSKLRGIRRNIPLNLLEASLGESHPKRLNNPGLNDFPCRIPHPDLDTLRGETVTSCANAPAGPRWLLESFELAKDKAYQGGRIPGGQEGSALPPLPAEYGQQVKAVCERRAALAGYRLAALLQDLM
jgi:hypothetical protein